MTREEKIVALKQALWKRARRKFPNDEARQRAYVYGTITKVKEHL